MIWWFIVQVVNLCQTKRYKWVKVTFGIRNNKRLLCINWKKTKRAKTGKTKFCWTNTAPCSFYLLAVLKNCPYGFHILTKIERFLGNQTWVSIWFLHWHFNGNSLVWIISRRHEVGGNSSSGEEMRNISDF